MKKNKKLWKQKFRTPPQPPISSAPPPVPGRSVPPPPAPDPADREEIRQILETAMLNLLREIKSRDLHDLQLHTLVTLTNNVARAMISNNRVQKSPSQVVEPPHGVNDPSPNEAAVPDKYAELRHYPEDWNDVQEISGVDPDEGREAFLLNDPGLREVCINLERAYGDMPRDKIEAYYNSPEGIAEILASPFAEEAWNKKRGIKVRSTWDKMLDEAYAKEAEKQPLQ